MNLNNSFYLGILLLIGFIFHLLFSYSMFDIFFKFPLNYGMTPHSPDLSEEEILSNRIAIFILDGARSDIFFEIVESGKSPFIKNIIEKRGVYGISHTEIPTETQPCFTAIFSGHFEDGALALKDLSKTNVLLDSIFNESNSFLGYWG